jgi:hypothetical protein
VEEESYTVQEAARILRTTERTVRRRPTHEAGLGRTQRPYKMGLSLRGIWNGRRAPSTLAWGNEPSMNASASGLLILITWTSPYSHNTATRMASDGCEESA